MGIKNFTLSTQKIERKSIIKSNYFQEVGMLIALFTISSKYNKMQSVDNLIE